MEAIHPVSQDQIDSETEVLAEAMKDQLRNDVTSWKAARSEETARRADISVPVVKPVPVKSTSRVRQTKAVNVAVQPVDDRKKPFGMSYDGMSQADYITYMISRGAR